MLPWVKISLMLCFFIFLKELRPSEPFVTEYLSHPWRNISIEVVNREVYPLGTYAYTAQLVIVFLITDLLRYKPLIIVSGISGIIVWSMLLWTTSLRDLQILELFYGTYLAAEVAYYAYIYAKVDKKHYLKITSHTRAAALVGRFCAGGMGQILADTKLMDYRQLNYITLAAQIGATIWAFCLPSVDTSLYFHRKNELTNGNNGQHVENEMFNESSTTIPRRKYRNAFILLWSHFKGAYTNPDVIIWSIWYSVAMCGNLQVISYVQVLWATIDDSFQHNWNGAVEAFMTPFGAVVALLAGYLHTSIFSRKTTLWSLAILSAFEGCAILLLTYTTSRIMSYLFYLLFCILYSFTITVASAEVAKNLEDDCFGLVLGINTLVALLLQSLLTLIVISARGLALPIRQQYLFLACYFFVLASFYVTTFFCNSFQKRPSALQQEYTVTTIDRKKHVLTDATENNETNSIVLRN